MTLAETNKDSGFIALDAMVAAGLASLLAIGAIGALSEMGRYARRAEAIDATWALAQRLIETKTAPESGVTDNGLSWSVMTGPDRILTNSSVRFQIVTAHVRSADGASLASLSTRRPASDERQ